MQFVRVTVYVELYSVWNSSTRTFDVGYILVRRQRDVETCVKPETKRTFSWSRFSSPQLNIELFSPSQFTGFLKDAENSTG